MASEPTSDDNYDRHCGVAERIHQSEQPWEDDEPTVPAGVNKARNAALAQVWFHVDQSTDSWASYL